MQAYNYIKSTYPKELLLLISLSGDYNANCSVENVNWNLFVDLVKKHRLVSHVIKNKLTKELVPEPILESLKQIQLDQIKRSLLFNSELLRIHKKLNELKMDHLFFKGSLLSYKLYHDIGFRNFRDIDLLIDAKDVEEAKSIIQNLNYDLFEPKYELSRKQKQINYSISHHYHLRHKKLPIDIELHWNLSNPNSFFSVSTKKLLRLKSMIDFQSYRLPYISNSENLVFLAAHGSVHQFYRLFWLKDFSNLIAQTDIETLKKAWELSQKLKLQKCFLQACKLSELIFKTEPPEFITTNSIKKWLIQIPLKAIATTELKQQGVFGKIKYPFYRMQLKADIKYYFDLLYRLRTHFSDWEILNIPENLFFLYYLLRPFLLLYKLIVRRN